jgi:hypothetical protein
MNRRLDRAIARVAWLRNVTISSAVRDASKVIDLTPETIRIAQVAGSNKAPRGSGRLTLSRGTVAFIVQATHDRITWLHDAPRSRLSAGAPLTYSQVREMGFCL